ncbi:ABC1 family, putative [Plasmodium gallinaceum]|uniref:ABC1 family, putative n=1 Tax=Plasmodium gallinaceum TaxID=5849 RepID=A0A1J1H2F9_PLAGA|nr:ABC1 family, putative [Plasmodium gallinaceum]CRG97683.1 ABC1 family, putative [Plasmodium gallinaceum]
MIAYFKIKKKINPFYKRYYMSNREIIKFKKNNNDDNSQRNNEKIKIYKSENFEYFNPFEIYSWSYIFDTKNEKLINDIIQYKKKKKNVTLLDFYKIINRYNIVINVNENDMFVENKINNYFFNFMNNIEYYFNNYEYLNKFLKSLKKNESFIFFYIYNNLKFLHVLPFKFFWHYQNYEELYNLCSKNEEENDNEYLFNNLDLNKVNFFLREDMISNLKSTGEIEKGEVEDKNVIMNKHENEKKNEEFNYGNYNKTNKYIKNFIPKKNDYDIKNNIYKIKSENENNIKNGNQITRKSENIKSKHEHKMFSNFKLINQKKYISNMISPNNVENIYKKKLKNDDYKNFDSGKKLNSVENENNDNLKKKINVFRDNDSMNDINLKKNNNKSYNNENLDRNDEQKKKENQIYEKVIEEDDFSYDINILNKKITNNEKLEQKKFRISKVPVSSFSRASVFGKVFFNIAKNSSFEYIKNMLINKNNSKDVLINEKNAEILANGLSKMRGVVLKLGQMISMQDEYISPILAKALKIVHNSADIMPKSQLIQVLTSELGDDFEKKFDFFNYEPFASASIGQVHEALINNNKVAVKIQYPGVYESIENDIRNLLFVNQYTNLILKNLYIDNLCNEIKKELKCECDYINEAKYYALFRNIFQKSKYFYVPSIYSEYITKKILVTSYVKGISIDEVAEKFPQNIRDSIGQRILYLCLHELFVFKIMNTDPNLGNFLYDTENDKLCLIDFGATRSYKNEFVDQYLRLVKASTEEHESKIYHYSYMLNFFNGKENEEMRDSHIKSVILVGEPFKTKVYDFGKGDLAKQIYNLLPKIIYNRLIPPRSEIYTLHRKLSGSYLICMKLKAKVKAADIFNSIYKNYKFSISDTYKENKK